MNYVKQAGLSVKIHAFELIVLFVFRELKENDDHFLSNMHRLIGKVYISKKVC